LVRPDTSYEVDAIPVCSTLSTDTVYAVAPDTEFHVSFAVDIPVRDHARPVGTESAVSVIVVAGELVESYVESEICEITVNVCVPGYSPLMLVLVPVTLLATNVDPSYTEYLVA
jgi:hypothetical protein